MWKKFIALTVSTLIAVGCVSKKLVSEPPLFNRCSQLKAELNYIHTSLMKNFVGAVHDPRLRQKAEHQFAEEMNRADSCQNNIDFFKSLRRYFSIFNDPHVNWKGEKLEGVRKTIFEVSTGKTAPEESISIQFSATGIFLSKIGERFFITALDPEFKDLGPLKTGDELLSCSSKTPLDILKSEILPYETVSSEPAALSNLAPLVFFRWDIEPGSLIPCSFQNQSGQFNQSIQWQPVLQDYLKKKFQNPPKNVYEIEKTNYGHWIKIRNFAGYDEETNKQLSQFVEDAKTLRKSKVIVLDVRGNTGGNSSWGEAWIRNLFGYVKELKPKFNFVLASEDNTVHFQRLYSHLKKTNGISGNEEYWEKLLSALRKNPGKFSDIELPQSLKGKQRSKLFQGKIYILTDFRVFSSGEAFVEMIKEMPGVVQVGLPTNASTFYSDIRFDLTPGGLVFVHPTIALYGGDFKRESGAPLIPKIRIDYDPESEIQGKDSMRMRLEKLIYKNFQ